MDRWLPYWACAGLLVLLCAPWLMPSTKLYHQLIIFMLWLPALLFLVMGSNRFSLFSIDAGLYLVLAGWTIMVTIFTDGEESLGNMKRVLYVSLTLVAILLASNLGEERLKNLLLLAALMGGLGAGVSWGLFYLVDDGSFSDRLIAIGIWDTIIMAAHAVGALAVLGVVLIMERFKNRYLVGVAVIAAIGYLLFLVSSQTRGVWIALVAALSVALLAVPLRLRWLLLIAGLGVVSIVAFVDPGFLLQRGLSYRPALWAAGMQLFFENPLMGLGFHDFQLKIHALEQTFKHPHNVYINIAIRFGAIGLLLYLALWGRVLWAAWKARGGALGRATLALWVFSTVCLLTDGIGLWDKPNADWLVIWLPIGLGMVLARSRIEEAV